MSYAAFGDTDPCQAQGMVYDEASDSCVRMGTTTVSTPQAPAPDYQNLPIGPPTYGGGGGGGGAPSSGGGGVATQQAGLGGGSILLGLVIVAAIGYAVVAK